MTCVLGMVVRREREIREFVETSFYRVLSTIGEKGQNMLRENGEQCKDPCGLSLLICIRKMDLKSGRKRKN